MEECWNILLTYDRKIIEQYPDHLNCKICNKLTIDAVQRECGCNFCKRCIDDNMSKQCPGNSKFCRASTNSSIQKDHRTNMEVIWLSAKCPNDSCLFTKELRKLPKHMKECTMSPVKCPFEGLGCLENKLTNDSIDKHLELAIHQHSIQTAETLAKLNETTSNLTKEHRNDKIPFTNMTKQLEIVNKNLEEQRKTNDVLEKRLNKANDAIAHLNSHSESLTLEVNNIKSQMKDNTNEFMDFKKYMSSLLTELRESDKKKEIENKKVVDEQRKDNRLLRKELENIIKLKNDIALNITEFQTKSKIINEHLIKQNYGEFIWKMDHFTDKRKSAREGNNEEILSPPFYSRKNGYKLQLKLSPNGTANGKGKFVGIFFYVLIGDFDDILEWPLTETIYISILDHDTMEDAIRVVYRYDDVDDCDKHVFHRQKKNNVGFGCLNFCKIDSLVRNCSFLKNDTLYIRCLVGSPTR